MRQAQKDRIILASEGRTITMRDGSVYTDKRTLVKLKSKSRPL